MNTFAHGWSMGFGWLIPLLLIAIFFYIFLDKKKEKSSAQEILDKRYASGGISKEEYEEKSKVLKIQNN
ncbi:MAG: SHOCT domain-containing protein [Sulfurovum sp.]|nr:MAG: SHOCT domain-containing protein [Sulfurovum sp.]RUM72795.1 MAG: SHOCT domain-containing protein [Sulfurovum sp.]